MRITESAAYLKGLVDGLELDTATKEGKIISKMIDVLEEMAVRINDLEDENDELYSYIEEMGADIVALEDDFYGEYDEAEYDDLDDLLEDEDVDDEEYYEVECPSCGEKVCFAADIDIEKLTCPACGELIGDIEFVDECDGDCESCASKNCDE